MCLKSDSVDCKGSEDNLQTIISDTLGEECDYEVVRNIHDNLNEMIEASKEEPEPLELARMDVKKLFAKVVLPQKRWKL